jgi:hypothetical protein
MRRHLVSVPSPAPQVERSTLALDDYVTTSYVAAKISTSRAWVFQLYKSGRLPGVLIGRAPGEQRGGVLRFKLSDVIAFIEGKS